MTHSYIYKYIHVLQILEGCSSHVVYSHPVLFHHQASKHQTHDDMQECNMEQPGL